jgi:hypothetical protein
MIFLIILFFLFKGKKERITFQPPSAGTDASEKAYLDAVTEHRISRTLNFQTSDFHTLYI